jgi:hypothetical protein
LKDTRSILTRVARIATALAVVGAAWAAAPETMAQGCSMCRASIGEAGDPLPTALAWSILFLLAMPFAVVASVGGWLYLSWRKGDPWNDELIESEDAPPRIETEQGE